MTQKPETPRPHIPLVWLTRWLPWVLALVGLPLFVFIWNPFLENLPAQQARPEPVATGAPTATVGQLEPVRNITSDPRTNRATVTLPPGSSVGLADYMTAEIATVLDAPRCWLTVPPAHGTVLLAGEPLTNDTPFDCHAAATLAYRHTHPDAPTDSLTISYATHQSVPLAVPRGTNGGSPDHALHSPVLSDDGRYVAFESDATNLLATPTPRISGIFWHDRATGDTRWLTQGYDQSAPNGRSTRPDMDASGRFVVFESQASNLVPGDTNAMSDVFLYDLDTSTLERISQAPDGSPANGASSDPAISADGRYVAYVTEAGNIVEHMRWAWSNIAVYDRSTGETLLASTGEGGYQGTSQTSRPSISGNGRYVTFVSFDSSLVRGDFNTLNDVFLHDMHTGETRLVSADSNGEFVHYGLAGAAAPVISDDGRYLVYHTDAPGDLATVPFGEQVLMLYDVQQATLTPIGTHGYAPALSADGQTVVFRANARDIQPASTTTASNIYRYDHLTGETTLVSATPDGTPARGASDAATIAASGQTIAFATTATTLTVHDGSPMSNIVLVDTGEARITLNIEAVP